MYSFKLPNGGYITLRSNDSPYEVNAVSAETGERSKRDFRLVTGIPPYVNPVLWDWEDANNTVIYFLLFNSNLISLIIFK